KQEQKLQPFYNVFPTLENFQELVKKRSFDMQRRKVLASSVEAQYERFIISEETRVNIGRLKESNTFTVTTGHQLNIFTGPLYFIYKIISTINLAVQLKQTYPNYHFVPVYWMASEDHDFAEINHFYFDNVLYSWNSEQRGAVGQFKLDQEMKELLNKVPFVPDFFKEAYLKQEKLADAVRYYVNHLFGDKGLVIVDGNTRELKSQFRSVIKDDVFQNRANELVNSTSEKLDQMGYKSQ